MTRETNVRPRIQGEGLTIVTAAVDRISLLHPPTTFCDMELRGMVTWTSGRSSMEISLEVVALNENKTVLTCQFTMVALDPVTKKSVLPDLGLCVLEREVLSVLSEI